MKILKAAIKVPFMQEFRAGKALAWIALLGFVATSLHNFFLSLSVDGALYANVAKNIVLSGEWLHLKSGIPEFQPYFAEHPHLGFWIYSLAVRLFGTHDWALRTVGQGLYPLTLFLFFLWIRRRSPAGSTAPYLFVAVLWSMALFSRFYGQVYLDPIFFFFGVLAVFALDLALETPRSLARIAWSLVAGLALAFCAMAKGMSFLGFGPVMAYLSLRALRRPEKSPALVAATLCLATCAATLALYWLAIRNSSVPDFFESYFARQWSGRFSHQYQLGKLLRPGGWGHLLVQTNFLIVLVPLALVWRSRRRASTPAGRFSWRAADEPRFAIPTIAALSFILMYFPANRVAAQYFIPILPWAAWLVSLGLADLLGERPRLVPRLVRITSLLAVIALMVANYVPLKIRKIGEPHPLAIPLKRHLDDMDRRGTPYALSFLHKVDIGSQKDTFVKSANWSWYLKRDVRLASESNFAAPNANLIVQLFADPDLESSLRELKFCPLQSEKGVTIWTGCEFHLLDPVHWSNTPGVFGL